MVKVSNNKAKNTDAHSTVKKVINIKQATKKGLNSVFLTFDSIFLKSNLKNFS